MSAKKSAYINKEGFIEAVESSNFLEGKALAAQIEEAAELLTDDEFFDVKPIKELMKTLHGERRWSWGLRSERKIKIFNEVVDFKLKDDEWRESLLPQIEKKRDEIAKEGRTAGENSEGSGDKKASKKDERRYQFTGINYKGTTINGGVTLDGCVVLSIGNRGEYTSDKMSEEQVEKLCEQGFFKKMIAKIAEATKDELSDSDFSRAIIKTINQAAEAQNKTYEAFGQSIESYLDDIKDGIVDIKNDINDIKSKVGKIEKETKEAHQKQNEKLDNIEYNSEETKQGIHALQEQVGALSGQLGNALEMLYSINNFAYNAKNGYTTYADKEVAAVLNEQKRYGGVVVNIEFKIGEESYCEQKDPNASLNIKDVEFMKLLAIALTEERRLNRNGNIDIVKTFLERVKGMLSTVNCDLGDKDIKEALQEYVETLKKGDNTDDVEYDENLVGKLSKKYKIAIDNAEKDEDGNISLVVSRGDAANINGWTFCDNNDIKSIKFSRGITQIDEDAINNCKALKTVIFPASIREISEGAISSCDALERLIVESGNRRYRSVNDCIIDCQTSQLVLGCKKSVIPDDGSVLSIRAFAFSGYNGLDIKIPVCIETIQKNAFFNCSGIIKCEVTSKPDGWNGMWASTESELAVKWKEIPKPQTALAVLSTTLPQNMVEASPQKAKENADKRPQKFALAKDLTKKYGINIIAAEEDESGKYKITISGKTKEIPAEKFKGIEEISHVTIEDGVTSIGEEAFFACKGLTSIVLPDSVTNIGDKAFWLCGALKAVAIPKNVTSIGYRVFAQCTVLKQVVFNEGVRSIGDRAFQECAGLQVVKLPHSLACIAQYAFNACRNLTSVTIPDSVTIIGAHAFEGCDKLSNVVIPASVQAMGSRVFTAGKIICRAKSKPKGWYDDWQAGAEVIWEEASTQVAEKTRRQSCVNGGSKTNANQSADKTPKPTNNQRTASRKGTVQGTPKPTANKPYIRVNYVNKPDSKGEYIMFGEYPQTIKAQSVSIRGSADKDGYYRGSDGERYAKVVANPYFDGYTFSDGSKVTKGAIYYFKVEPIRWRILSEESGKALLLADRILEKHYFHYTIESIRMGLFKKAYANNYKHSDIRAWLNGEFLNTAFGEVAQSLIETTEVDNSVYSTGYASNLYACENTFDKVFLLSYREVVNSDYGFSSDTERRMTVSDYARSTGAYMNTNNSYFGCGYWWLRSPYYLTGYRARFVFSYGYANNFLVNYVNIGVVPALNISLDQGDILELKF